MKSLIAPVVTPSGLPSEAELVTAQNNGGVITLHGAESTTHTERLIDGVPQSFQDNCAKLLQSFAGRVSGILVGGTTGEGAGLGPLQYRALLTAMKKACPEGIHLYAGALGGDSQVGDQVRVAQELGYDVVLGLNNPECDNMNRFKSAMEALGSTGRLFLYNLPTFKPADKEFVLKCLNDPRVIGFKDSSGDAEFFRWLLSLKEKKPDLQIFHGSEIGYGRLLPEELVLTDGLVAGTANVYPKFLGAFTDNPHNEKIFHRLREIHTTISSLSKRDPKTHLEHVKIWRYIHALKILLERNGILKGSSMYCHPADKLFQTYKG